MNFLSFDESAWNPACLQLLSRCRERFPNHSGVQKEMSRRHVLGLKFGRFYRLSSPSNQRQPAVGPFAGTRPSAFDHVPRECMEDNGNI